MALGVLIQLDAHSSGFIFVDKPNHLFTSTIFLEFGQVGVKTERTYLRRSLFFSGCFLYQSVGSFWRKDHFLGSSVI